VGTGIQIGDALAVERVNVDETLSVEQIEEGAVRLSVTSAPADFTVSDGTTTVTGITEIDFPADSVSGTTGTATITFPEPPSLEVTDASTGDVTDVTSIEFVGATVTGSTGAATVTITTPSLEVTDGGTDLTGVTSITFPAGAVSGTGGDATIAYNTVEVTDGVVDVADCRSIQFPVGSVSAIGDYATITFPAPAMTVSDNDSTVTAVTEFDFPPNSITGTTGTATVAFPRGANVASIGSPTGDAETTLNALIASLRDAYLLTRVAVGLKFVQQPTGAAANAAITPAITVQVVDDLGHIVTSITPSITVALTIPGGAILSGVLGHAASNGVATFAGLSVDTEGSYTLTATATDLSPDVSSSFIIGAA
jgi:hypothetical protein